MIEGAVEPSTLMPTITSLEKSARLLSKKLTEAGLTVEIDVFKTGKGGTQFYGPSYVELTIRSLVTTPEGETDEGYAHVKFVAGEYYVSGRDEFGGGDTWSEMKTKSLKSIKKQLALFGWTSSADSVFDGI